MEAPWSIQTSNSLRTVALKPDDLARVIPFLTRGLDHIRSRIRPDWEPQHIMATLFAGTASCVLLSRGCRHLGFVVYHRQERPWSKKPELFIWAAYDLPLKERLPDDRFDEVVAAAWHYLCNTAKVVYGTDIMSWITSSRRAKAFERKYGWRSSWTIFNVSI